MPKPTNKKELIRQSDENFDILFQLVNSYPTSDQNNLFHKETLNRNIRDVLMHLHLWHLLMLDWYTKGMADLKPHMPAKNYTWKTLPLLNKNIWHKSQKINLKKSKTLLKKSHLEIQSIIKSHTNEELFTKKKYFWTGSTSLGAYLISNTSSHYNWAIKQIKKGLK